MPTNQATPLKGMNNKTYAVQLVDTGTQDIDGNEIYLMGVSANIVVESIDIGKVDQGAKGTDAWLVDLGGTQITGETMETGGQGWLGWITSIRHGINALVTAGIGLIASENHIGSVGGNCITKSVTFNRPAATTQYSAKDNVGTDIPVTGATNASPIVVTAVAHGLADGDYVTLSNVGGNTNANGSYYAKVTAYSVDTFALYTDKALTTPRAGNSNWTSGGDVARLFRLKGIFRKAGGDGYITQVRVGVNSATALLGDYFRIHFYSAPVASVLDNLTYPVLWANMPNRNGYVDVPAMTTEGGGSDMAYALAGPGSVGNSSVPGNVPMHVENKETIPDTDLYFKIEETTATPGTPAANQPIFVEVTVDNN